MLAFSNLISVLVLEVESNNVLIVKVLRQGGYEIMSESLKENEVLLRQTLQNIVKIIDLEVNFSLDFLRDNSVLARLHEAYLNTEDNDIRSLCGEVIDRS